MTPEIQDSSLSLPMYTNEPNLQGKVIEVYADNYVQEINKIAVLIEHYNYIAMVSYNNTIKNILLT